MAIHVVIPAGGTGSRFGNTVPKQFHAIHGRLVLEWAMLPFLRERRVDTVSVVLADQVPDAAREALVRLQSVHRGRIRLCLCAGATRALTVAAGLEDLASAVRDDPWVLVHDAARPGLPADALSRLIEALAGEPVGALLALPVADTMKRGGDGQRVAATVPREGMWQAQTPQAFRLALLREALHRAGPAAGDEATAVEALGLQPRLVEGDLRNVKLTRPGDGALIAAVLAAREDRCA